MKKPVKRKTIRQRKDQLFKKLMGHPEIVARAIELSGMLKEVEMVAKRLRGPRY